MVKAVFGLDDGEPPLVVFKVVGVVVQTSLDHGIQKFVMGAQLGHDELQLLHGIGDGPGGVDLLADEVPHHPQHQNDQGTGDPKDDLELLDVGIHIHMHKVKGLSE